MKNKKQKIIGLGLSTLSLAIMASASASAWGPERPTYTVKNPADHVTFNSITDHPSLGDERNFVRVAEAGVKGVFKDEVKVEAGKEYEVYIWYHNNAASNLNPSGKGIATGTRVYSKFPSSINSSKKWEVNGTISSTNATPESVWDQAYFTTDSKEDILLQYVPGSAILSNGYKANGRVMSDKMFTSEGAYLGVDELNGMLPGCDEFSGNIVYRVRAVKRTADVSKSASLDGKNFFKSVSPQPGDTITYKIEFANTGNVDLANIVFRDKLPEHTTLIPGTTKMINKNYPDGTIMPDTITENGFNVGTFAPGAKATIYYQVKVDEDAAESGSCGMNSLNNTVIVNYDHNVATGDNGGDVEDTATINIERVCTEEEKKIEEKQEKKIVNTPKELPKTGPGEVALVIVGVAALVAVVWYWYKSQQDLNRVTSAIKGATKKNSGTAATKDDGAKIAEIKASEKIAEKITGKKDEK
ncbi:DUF11 domain-containing protein [Candidatus Saccharibacteria bacterium]|nr:DUF11 domain-containing protein [Candidatus Saccharibacteria bacterium]